MRVLLDTNVIIQSEDDVELSEHVQQLHSLAQKHQIQLYVHQQNRVDLANDRDERRRKITIAKMGKYPQLEFNQNPNSDFYNSIGATSFPGTNDFIDDCLLFALSNHATTYLISEDKGVHAKARKVDGLEDRTFFIVEFIEFIKEKLELVTSALPAIEEVEISTLDINDPIFDSLKNDYSGFVDWFHRKAEQGRRSWIMMQESGLAAVCIYDPCNKDCENGMKICTFKVGDALKGMRAGEHLLKQAMIFAVDNGIPTINIEVFSDKAHLITWLEDFGFYQASSISKNGRTELVFKKDMTPITEISGVPFELAIRHYPFLPEPPRVKCYVIPIQPQFSNVLFPELVPQGSLWLSPCGQAIKKVYICNANINTLQKGDLLLFYESRNRKSIFARGVVDDILRSSDPDEMLTFVAKRSVYSQEYIRDRVSEGGALAIKFYQSCLPMNAVAYRTLKYTGVLNAAPQSIVQLRIDEYIRFQSLL